MFMNVCNCEILKHLGTAAYANQRVLAEETGYSVGAVNKAIRELNQTGYLDQNAALTETAIDLLEKNAPKRAIILAAGYGMRMVPINMEFPKALLEINGEPLIERQIRQLHEVGIREIYVVVGFMKERFEYLIDTYGVTLLVNSDYAAKNNLHSLKKALPYLSDCYVVPCDIWCQENPFSTYELYSWYMVSDRENKESTVRANRKMELVTVSPRSGGNGMIGISYLAEADAAPIRDRISVMTQDSRFDEVFWEEALLEKGKMRVYANVVPADTVAEINTYEQLREMDSNSKQLRSDAIEVVAKALQVAPPQIQQIKVLKKGMTNRSFLFCCQGEKYIMRIPGEGTDQLISRSQEAAVYGAIRGRGLCDDPVYLNPENGYKVTRYIENVRCCDPDRVEDLKICMEKLRSFHDMALEVPHCFDIFEKIDFYESLWEGNPSVYRDYATTKQHVLQLRPFIEAHVERKVLTHIDAVPDNFLFDPNGENGESVQLTDWEYAGMQDPHVDIAMFCIYSMYDRPQVERLIDLYFPEGCTRENRLKIYCYIAACGLLWSNWCEYKRNLGVEFGEYSLRQYRFAKDYYKIFCQEMEKEGQDHVSC